MDFHSCVRAVILCKPSLFEKKMGCKQFTRTKYSKSNPNFPHLVTRNFDTKYVRLIQLVPSSVFGASYAVAYPQEAI